MRKNHATPHVWNHLLQQFIKGCITGSTRWWCRCSEERDGVAELKEGEWSKYDVLPRFARSMASFFNSNSEVERAFSAETDFYRDPKKNRMRHDTQDAH